MDKLTENNLENEEPSDDSEDEDFVPQEEPEDDYNEDSSDEDPDIEDSRKQKKKSGRYDRDQPKYIKKTKIEDESILQREQEEKKKEINDIWAELNADIPASEPVSSSIGSLLNSGKQSTNNKTVDTPKSKLDELDTFDFSKIRKSSLQQELEEEPTVLKKYDYAGETVEVREKINSVPKKKSGLGNLMSQLEKPKMSTYQKTQLDWNTYKKENEIDEFELKRQHKDGYLEKKNFLERTDVRIWESEREARKGRNNK